MRIACIHVPQFPLQVALRTAPAALDGRAIAIVAGGGGGRALGAPVVVACSRAARALGVRIGMAAAVARAYGDQLVVEAIDPTLVAEATAAIADVLLGLAPSVDRGGDARGSHHAAYAEVPTGTRGATFGARVTAALDTIGFRVRVGIADDRFAAWVAASRSTVDDDGAVDTVVSVPRGGSATFLAPLPLSLLAIPPEVQHVLGALGVHTLGEFASLPPPSVARAWDADYQQLARGEGGASLDVYTPRGTVREAIGIGGDIGAGVAVAMLAARLSMRFAGRDAPGRATVVVESAGEARTATFEPGGDVRSVTDASALADRIAAAIAQVGCDGATALAVMFDSATRAIAPAVAGATIAAAIPASRASDDGFRLVAPNVRRMPATVLRAPRRPVRGKQRPRIAVAAQSRLFGD